MYSKKWGNKKYKSSAIKFNLFKIPPHNKNQNYEDEVRNIKIYLSHYSKVSILNRCINLLARIHPDNEARARAMPHLIFLLIKWSSLAPKKDAMEITRNEFSDITNRIHSLQHLAMDFTPGCNFNLKLRVMIMQQVVPQKNNSRQILSMSRQRLWFSSKTSNYYDENFKRITGISIDSFFSISFYLSVLADKNTPTNNNVTFQELVEHLTPEIEINDLASYIKLIGLRKNEYPLYLENHRQNANPKWEYHAETPLIEKPLIIESGSITFLDGHLFLRSCSDFISRLLKREKSDFKNYFGRTMEDYIENLFKSLNISHFKESQIIQFYREISKKKSKVVDFILDGDVRVFIDSKAIEPTAPAFTSHDPDVLRNILNQSYISAIFQAQECCKTLSVHPNFPAKESYALIIVHQDYFLSSGARIEEYIYPTLSTEIQEKYGEIPIPIKNVYFATLDDLETLSTMEENEKGSVTRILRKAVLDDAKQETQKMLFGMHMMENSKVKLNKNISENAQNNMKKGIQIILNNKKHWQLKNDELELKIDLLGKLVKKIHYSIPFSK